MFVCKQCCEKRGVDTTFFDFRIAQSHGRCELCGKTSACLDRRLPLVPPDDKPAPSEDGGEELGRRLHEIREQERGRVLSKSPPGKSPDYEGRRWRDHSEADREAFTATALRFRAECVEQYEKLAAHASWLSERLIHKYGESENLDYHHLTRRLAGADQGEAAEDKPRVSDRELGQVAVDALNLKLHGAQVHAHSPVLERIGAAIRAKMEGKP